MSRPVRYGGEFGGVKGRTAYTASIAAEALAPTVAESSDRFDRGIERQPQGVVFVIAPWNYPYLAATNTIVPVDRRQRGHPQVREPNPPRQHVVHAPVSWRDRDLEDLGQAAGTADVDRFALACVGALVVLGGDDDGQLARVRGHQTGARRAGNVDAVEAPLVGEPHVRPTACDDICCEDRAARPEGRRYRDGRDDRGEEVVRHRCLSGGFRTTDGRHPAGRSALPRLARLRPADRGSAGGVAARGMTVASCPAGRSGLRCAAEALVRDARRGTWARSRSGVRWRQLGARRMRGRAVCRASSSTTAAKASAGAVPSRPLLPAVLQRPGQPSPRP
jgi:hypothetical protein